MYKRQGVGALHPWVDAYTTPTRRNRGGWKAPVITNTALDVFNEYGEFYLLQLPDESYILAQLPREEDVYKRQITKCLLSWFPGKAGTYHSADFQVCCNNPEIIQTFFLPLS